MLPKLVAIAVALAIMVTTFPALCTTSRACGLDGGAGCELPVPLADPGAALVDKQIYIFGGVAQGKGMQDSIMVYDIPSNGLNTILTKMPNRLTNPNAFALDGKIYVYGGEQEGSAVHSRNLTVFTPPSTLENHQDFFPYEVEGGAQAFDGRYLYIFGNCMNAACGQRNLTRVDLRNMTREVLPDVLPNQTAGASAVWYKGSAYIFGGKTVAGRLLDSIRKYTPGKDLEVLSQHLPTPLMKFGLVQKDNYAYILGGMTPDSMSDQVLRVDLDTMEIEITGTVMCKPKATRSVVGWGNNAYIVGGNTKDGPAQGIEVLTLPVPEPPADKEGYDTGNLVLAAGITGALLVILVTIFIISRRKK